MDMNSETLIALGKDGGLLAAVWYLWNRVNSVTDAYLTNSKETARGNAESTAAINNIARSLDELTRAVRKED